VAAVLVWDIKIQGKNGPATNASSSGMQKSPLDT
jgi:hypothetical protein